MDVLQSTRRPLRATNNPNRYQTDVNGGDDDVNAASPLFPSALEVFGATTDVPHRFKASAPVDNHWQNTNSSGDDENDNTAPSHQRNKAQIGNARNNNKDFRMKNDHEHEEDIDEADDEEFDSEDVEEYDDAVENENTDIPMTSELSSIDDRRSGSERDTVDKYRNGYSRQPNVTHSYTVPQTVNTNTIPPAPMLQSANQTGNGTEASNLQPSLTAFLQPTPTLLPPAPPGDGYVTVLVSSLRESHAALAESEAEAATLRIEKASLETRLKDAIERVAAERVEAEKERTRHRAELDGVELAHRGEIARLLAEHAADVSRLTATVEGKSQLITILQTQLKETIAAASHAAINGGSNMSQRMTPRRNGGSTSTPSRLNNSSSSGGPADDELDLVLLSEECDALGQQVASLTDELSAARARVRQLEDEAAIAPTQAPYHHATTQPAQQHAAVARENMQFSENDQAIGVYGSNSARHVTITHPIIETDNARDVMEADGGSNKTAYIPVSPRSGRPLKGAARLAALRGISLASDKVTATTASQQPTTTDNSHNNNNYLNQSVAAIDRHLRESHGSPLRHTESTSENSGQNTRYRSSAMNAVEDRNMTMGDGTKSGRQAHSPTPHSYRDNASSNATTTAEFESMRTRAETAEHTAAVTSAQLSTAQTRIVSLEDAVSATEASLEMARADVKDAKRELSATAAQLTASEAAAAALRRRLAAAEEEANDAKRTAARLQISLENALSDANEARAVANEQTLAAREAEKRNMTLRDALTRAEDEITTLRLHMERAVRAQQSAESEVTWLRQQVHDTRRQEAAAREEVMSLMTRLREREERQDAEFNKYSHVKASSVAPHATLNEYSHGMPGRRSISSPPQRDERMRQRSSDITMIGAHEDMAPISHLPRRTTLPVSPRNQQTTHHRLSHGEYADSTLANEYQPPQPRRRHVSFGSTRQSGLNFDDGLEESQQARSRPSTAPSMPVSSMQSERGSSPTRHSANVTQRRSLGPSHERIFGHVDTSVHEKQSTDTHSSSSNSVTDEDVSYRQRNHRRSVDEGIFHMPPNDVRASTYPEPNRQDTYQQKQEYQHPQQQVASNALRDADTRFAEDTNMRMAPQRLHDMAFQRMDEAENAPNHAVAIAPQQTIPPPTLASQSAPSLSVYGPTTNTNTTNPPVRGRRRAPAPPTASQSTLGTVPPVSETGLTGRAASIAAAERVRRAAILADIDSQEQQQAKVRQQQQQQFYSHKSADQQIATSDLLKGPAITSTMNPLDELDGGGDVRSFVASRSAAQAQSQERERSAPFATEANVADAEVTLASKEEDLLRANLQKNAILSEISSLAATAGRSVKDRARKEALEAELASVERGLAELKFWLKAHVPS